jgi:hypothetical protein
MPVVSTIKNSTCVKFLNKWDRMILVPRLLWLATTIFIVGLYGYFVDVAIRLTQFELMPTEIGTIQLIHFASKCS